MLKSSNGWPASKSRDEIGIESFPVPGTKIKLACAKSVAPLLVGFAAEFHELIEPIDEGGLDDWGYCFRMVRGSTDNLSNHASGTAIDLNATRHILGKAGTFPAEKVPMAMYMAGITDPKTLAMGGVAAIAPVILRWLNPKDAAFGVKGK